MATHHHKGGSDWLTNCTRRCCSTRPRWMGGGMCRFWCRSRCVCLCLGWFSVAAFFFSGCIFLNCTLQVLLVSFCARPNNSQAERARQATYVTRACRRQLFYTRTHMHTEQLEHTICDFDFFLYMQHARRLRRQPQTNNKSSQRILRVLLHPIVAWHPPHNHCPTTGANTNFVSCLCFGVPKASSFAHS